jgi:tetratricopeptide (TPR) repeat protein
MFGDTYHVRLRVISEDYLRRAIRAGNARRRMRWAELGLASAEDLDPDVQVLLLRQVYLGCLELRELRRAAEVAHQMVAVGALADLAHHDVARALFALGDGVGAIDAQQQAVAHAPEGRRVFHLWSLAGLLHFTGDADGALAALGEAEPQAESSAEGALVRAHAALIRVERGEAVEGLGRLLGELRRSRVARGYGQYLLGMIAHHMGDGRTAAVHLGAFLNRHAAPDVAKALTLREELVRARRALARWESV